ncbi:MAG: hypothetical protein K6G28_00950 [Acholeplasmatales bacterium]|nr:hypothetical protein [Acholeplasmatales bacterium]
MGSLYVEYKTTVSKFVKKINELNCTDNMKPLSYRVINAWLLKEGYLKVNDNNKKVPTKKGEELGLGIELRESAYGAVYNVVTFDENV